MGVCLLRPGRGKRCRLQGQMPVCTQLVLCPGCHALCSEALQLWMELGWDKKRSLGSTSIRGESAVVGEGPITEVWLCLRGIHVEIADRWLNAERLGFREQS